LRDYVIKALHHTGDDSDAMDGMDLALCIIDRENMRVSFAGANNPLYLIRDGVLNEFKGDKMPIGWHTRFKDPFHETAIDIRPGDCMYLFSDGYADQFGGSRGKKFMYKQFKHLLVRIHEKPMKEQQKILKETLIEWQGTHDQIDDIMVMGFRI
jgi:serine phosphatase RsbU (regulator of sigma subunit)